MLAAADGAAAWQKAMIVLEGSVRERDGLKAQVRRQEQEAMTRIAARLHIPFQAIESYMFGYFRLRKILQDAGWGTVAEQLGAEIGRGEIDPARHEIHGEAGGETFAVRSLGISVGRVPAHRAIVQAIRRASDDIAAPADGYTDDSEEE